MGKSIRSKVKRTFRGLKREILEPARTAQLEKISENLRVKAGVVKPASPDADADPASKLKAPRQHGGFAPLTTFTPTPKGPKLNVVHGPLAVPSDDEEQEGKAVENAQNSTHPPPLDLGGGLIEDRRPARPEELAAVGHQSQVEAEMEDVVTRPSGRPRGNRRAAVPCKKKKAPRVDVGIKKKSNKHPQNKRYKVLY
mmetsp:Transcript_8701/g.22893  ORF Transcript_8701/g.22893 Transcript_8701/m.22893 type:complete len:197 (-) Transcript_8701:256-846(-)|eukprot:CAMPEP_0184725078 /NCGR_PEP_ID=MMETSP0314-20130426/29854_1 /TAXON_ID=38298 /ORGANISM="Rhodella maculata, Strain CCMP 736" /LENGTH=196 /DNA_ID=CAMNT_0027190223 /DNA_START=96 /DNA_END=686 /DNA_ORIENTATION=+